MRYRKFGDTRTACSAVAIPSSNESPCLRARVTYPRYSFHFLGGGRPAERARREARQNRARAGVRVLSRGVAADINPAQALRRRAGRLIERTADIDRFVPVVHARFDGVRLDLRAVLAQRLDVLRGKLAARIDQRLGRPLGRLGTVIAWAAGRGSFADRLRRAGARPR